MTGRDQHNEPAAVPPVRPSRRVRRTLEGLAAMFVSSLVLVVISIGFSPVWVVLALSAGIAVASVPAFYLYEYLAARLRDLRR